jgi:arsenate reductase
MHDLSGLDYNDLFNKRARKYKEIKEQLEQGDDDQYKEHITQEYTFLKRPVVIYKGQVFVGNAKKTVELMLNTVNQ